MVGDALVDQPCYFWLCSRYATSVVMALAMPKLGDWLKWFHLEEL